MNRTLLIILLTSAVAISCNSSKSLSKKASKLEEAGMYSDAAEFYFNSLRKNQNNVDARIGLRENGQKLLNEKVDAFTKARALADSKTAVYNFLEALEYQGRIATLGVNLEIPQYIITDYEDSKKTYLNQLYTEGNELMASKNFDAANVRFSEVSRLDPAFKNTAELQNISRNEPLYISAIELYEKANYRKAFALFEDILGSDPAYKDCTQLRDDCLRKGTYTIAILPFENTTRFRGLEQKISAYALTELAALKDPFLKIIENENTAAIQEQQHLALSGIVDENTAVEVGNLLGAKAMISGQVLSYSTNKGREKVEEKQGYEAFQVKNYNKEEDRYYYSTQYKPVSYQEHYNTNEVSISFQYKLISLETGEILLSKIETKTIKDDIYYATYQGEATNLYPSNGKVVNTNSRDRKMLLELMRADRNLMPVEELSTHALQAVSATMANEVENYISGL